jgi:hypothetical protein
MAASEYTLEIEQGASFRRTLSWRQPDGTPVNLSHYTGARMEIRDRIGGKVLATLTIANGRIQLVDNEIRIYLPKSVTTAMQLPETGGVFDLFLDYGADDADKVVYGPVVYDKAVTRI